jgi:LPS sulfotransferase NodH
MLVHVADLAWEHYFREHAIEPLVVFYENFFRDVDQQLDRLIDHVGRLPGRQQDRQLRDI